MFGVIFIASATVSTISYLTLKKLTFAGAANQMREKVNKLAVPIRKQLLAEHGAQETSFINTQGFELKGFFIKHAKAEK